MGPVVAAIPAPTERAKNTEADMHLNICTSLFVVLAANSAFAQSAHQHQTKGGMDQVLLAADKAWEKVYSAKDLSKSVAVCDEQGSLLWPNTPIVIGKKAIAKAILDDFSSGDLTWHVNAVGVARSGDLGYTSGLYESKWKSAAGAPATDNGKYLTVWKKEADGTWKVLFDTFNSDRPLTTTH
jgi:ketosteroid isomerase-like protein